MSPKVSFLSNVLHNQQQAPLVTSKADRHESFPVGKVIALDTIQIEYFLPSQSRTPLLRFQGHAVASARLQSVVLASRGYRRPISITCCGESSLGSRSSYLRSSNGATSSASPTASHPALPSPLRSHSFRLAFRRFGLWIYSERIGRCWSCCGCPHGPEHLSGRGAVPSAIGAHRSHSIVSPIATFRALRRHFPRYLNSTDQTLRVNPGAVVMSLDCPLPGPWRLLRPSELPG